MCQGFATIGEHLAYFPKAQVHRNKQRLTKIHQYLLRMRKLKLRQINGTKSVKTRIHRKVEQREERREKKALVAAKIESSIEKELVERLARGTYGDIYNFPEVPYQKALEEAEKGEEDMEEEGQSEEELEVSGLFAFYLLPIQPSWKALHMLFTVLLHPSILTTTTFFHLLLKIPALAFKTEDEVSDEDGMIEYVEDLDEEDEEDMEDMDVNAWDDDGRSEEDSGSDDDDDDDNDESSEEDEEEGSSSNGSEDDDESGEGTDENESDDEAKKKRKKTSAKPFKKQQPQKPRRGVRVEIEYEDENNTILEDEGVSGGGAGLQW